MKSNYFIRKTNSNQNIMCKKETTGKKKHYVCIVKEFGTNTKSAL